MYLLIDWGNSRLKYLLVEKLADQAIDEAETQFASSLVDLGEQIEAVRDPSKLLKALVCSVKNDENNTQLQHLLQRLQISCFFAATSHRYSGIKLSYKKPEQMGVDRWMALIASFEQKQSVGIIDLGTAITVDLLDDKGNHLGGHIVPGLNMLKSSLLKTDKVRTKTSCSSASGDLSIDTLQDDRRCLLGNSTETCVSHGINQLISSYLNQIVLDAQREFGIVKWQLTGGDSQKWFDYLCEGKCRQFSPEFILSKKLIFQGLKRLCRQSVDQIE